MRILVTGSRDWPYPGVVRAELLKVWTHKRHVEPIVVIEGACHAGADQYAHEWADARRADGWDVTNERYPADWKIGKQAGHIRNQQMVDLGADLCLAFLLNHSRGTLDCMRRAEAAHIPIRIIELNITERS